MKNLTNILFIFVSAALLTSCSAGKDKTNVELIQDMMDQKNLKSQDYDEFSKTPSNRVPPEGTVPQGFRSRGQIGESVSWRSF
jgi:hypothetical protein